VVERLLVVHHVFLNLSSAANDTIPRKYADAVKSFTRHYAVGERRARQDGTDVVFEAAEGTEVYRLSAPYMTDAAGAMSRGLTLTPSPMTAGRRTAYGSIICMTAAVS